MKNENERLKHQNNAFMTQHVSNTMKINELEAEEKNDQPKEIAAASGKPWHCRLLSQLTFFFVGVLLLSTYHLNISTCRTSFLSMLKQTLRIP